MRCEFCLDGGEDVVLVKDDVLLAIAVVHLVTGVLEVQHPVLDGNLQGLNLPILTLLARSHGHDGGGAGLLHRTLREHDTARGDSGGLVGLEKNAVALRIAS